MQGRRKSPSICSATVAWPGCWPPAAGCCLPGTPLPPGTFSLHPCQLAPNAPTVSRLAARLLDPLPLLLPCRTHYVVFDLWTGRWEVLDAAKRGVPQARWGSGGKPCASQAAQSCAGRGHAACRAHAVQRPFLAPLKACPRRRRPALRAGGGAPPPPPPPGADGAPRSADVPAGTLRPAALPPGHPPLLQAQARCSRGQA
jgi:hypothetical protein